MKGIGLHVVAREVAYLAHIFRFRAALSAGDFEQAHAAWCNPSAAHPSLLEAIAHEADRGPSVLECGSGLTTLVLAQKGCEAFTLEGSERWRSRNLRRARLAGVNPNIHHTPIRSYGSYDWYDLGGVTLPDRFDLVVCDGPPSSTRGGRYGLLPTLFERLRGARILLDDVHRGGEQAIVERWESEYGTSAQVSDDTTNQKPFAIIDVP